MKLRKIQVFDAQEELLGEFGPLQVVLALAMADERPYSEIRTIYDDGTFVIWERGVHGRDPSLLVDEEA